MIKWPKTLLYKGREFCGGCLMMWWLSERKDENTDEDTQRVLDAYKAHKAGDDSLLTKLLEE